MSNSEEYNAAMSIFDARPQMGRESFDGLTLPQRVQRIFEIRDSLGDLAFALAGGVSPTCKSCKHWGKVEDGYPNKPDERTCGKMETCFCCRDEDGDQLAGAIGGGRFVSGPDFGCVQWKPR